MGAEGWPCAAGFHTGSPLDLSIDRRDEAQGRDWDCRAEARRAGTRDPRLMCIDRSCAAAAAELAARRTALADALDALERGDPGADPIAAIDCALALQAAEEAAEHTRLSGPALRA
jgi:hypothetical protein